MGGVQTIIITTTITPAGYGGSEKRKTSNEGRTHSPVLLRRPTIYVVGKKKWIYEKCDNVEIYEQIGTYEQHENKKIWKYIKIQ